MDDITKMAFEVVKAQASVRVIDPDEFFVLVKSFAEKLRTLTEGGTVENPAGDGVCIPTPAEAAKSIKEKSVTCLECGKKFKMLSKKHLASHGMTPAEYKEKFGIKKGTALIAKGVTRARSAKMKDMKLWERRGKTKAEGEPKGADHAGKGSGKTGKKTQGQAAGK